MSNPHLTIRRVSGLRQPIERAREVLDFALFVQAQMVAAAHDAVWDQAFAETDLSKAQAWLDSVIAENVYTDVDASNDILDPAPPQS